MKTIVFQAQIAVFGGLSEMLTDIRTDLHKLVSSLKNPRWNLSKQISEIQKLHGTSVTELRRAIIHHPMSIGHFHDSNILSYIVVKFEDQYLDQSKSVFSLTTVFFANRDI